MFKDPRTFLAFFVAAIFLAGSVAVLDGIGVIGQAEQGLSTWIAVGVAAACLFAAFVLVAYHRAKGEDS